VRRDIASGVVPKVALEKRQNDCTRTCRLALEVWVRREERKSNDGPLTIALSQMERKGSTMYGTLGAILAQLRAGLEALYGPRLVPVLLYGSQARGEATAESDIDVLHRQRGTSHSAAVSKTCTEATILRNV
jgi:hypothetical protein